MGGWQYDWEKKAKTVICFNSLRGLAVCYDVPLRPVQEPVYDIHSYMNNLIKQGFSYHKGLCILNYNFLSLVNL